jgi:hypothetical protein
MDSATLDAGVVVGCVIPMWLVAAITSEIIPSNGSCARSRWPHFASMGFGGSVLPALICRVAAALVDLTQLDLLTAPRGFQQI